MEDPTQPPGTLSPAGKLWEGFKHVASKALKWAAKAALVGGVIGLAVASLPATAAGILNMVTFGLSGSLGLSGPGALIGGLTSGLGLGAIVGGLMGAVSGLGGAGEAVDEAEDRSIATIHRAKTRQIQMAMMEKQMMQSQVAMAPQAQQVAVPGVPVKGQGPGMNVG